jgi:hypothetical protein
VTAGKAHELFLTFRRKLNVNLPAVGGSSNPLHQSTLHQAVRQSHGAVMPDKQGSCQISYRRAARSIERPHCQQELVLLRFQPVGMRSLLAELQETADLEAKVG